MSVANEIKEALATLKPIIIDDQLKAKVVSLLDLTRLQEPDDEESVGQFFEQAQTSFGPVAAVCVYPQYVRLVASIFRGTSIKVTAVANFPEGKAAISSVQSEIDYAISQGAVEIDVVFPYQSYLAGNKEIITPFIKACKTTCGDDVKLKVILETGAFGCSAAIAKAAYTVLSAGADFIKTSTGKIPQGANFATVAIMLQVIKRFRVEEGRTAGIKISGKIKDLQQAGQYICLTEKLLEKADGVKPSFFRIGSSKLIEEINS